MTKRYILGFFCCAIILIIGLAGYGVYINSTSSAHVAKMAASQYFKVGGATVEYREICPMIYLSAVNLYAPNMLDVHFEIDGTITRMHVKAGDKVQTGQLLAEIANSELMSQVLQADGKIRSAEANLVKWENTVNRYQRLEASNALSRQQLDEAVGNFQAAEGEVVAARAYHDQMVARLHYQQIVAPDAGEILSVYHSPGAVIRSGQSLLLMGDLSSLYFRTNISGTVLEQMQPLTGTFKFAVKSGEMGGKAYVSHFGIDSSGDGGVFDVQIAELTLAENMAATYRTILFKIDNGAGLLEPGTYHQVKIYSADPRRVLAVPKEAITGEGDPTVFIVNEDSRLDQRHIQVGVRDDNYVEVLNGLTEHDTVVISGKDGGDLTPGMKVRLVQST